jgi:hypothetical protein
VPTFPACTLRALCLAGDTPRNEAGRGTCEIGLMPTRYRVVKSESTKVTGVAHEVQSRGTPPSMEGSEW